MSKKIEASWPTGAEAKGAGRTDASQLFELQSTLKRMDELREEIRRGMRHMEELAEEATRATSRLSPVQYGGMARRSKVEHAVISSLDLEQELKEQKEELNALAEWVTSVVNRLPVGTSRTIVKLRFLEGLSCAAIAWRLHYSRSYVYKALAEGMAAVVSSSPCPSPEQRTTLHPFPEQIVPPRTHFPIEL